MSKLEKYWRFVVNKGHERLTFMVIPHGEAHILSLQVSKFAIFFGMIAIVLIMGVSVLSSEIQEQMEPEITQLYDANQTSYYKREQYLKKLNQMLAYHAELKKNILVLADTANLLENDSDVFLTNSALYEKAKEEINQESTEFESFMNSLIEKKKAGDIKLNDEHISLLDEFAESRGTTGFSYNSDVLLYRKLHLDILQSVNLISVLEDFIEERIDVQKNLPYYWPVAGGHFTSFYGPRFSPFGSNSEFHLGIDLAAQTGTPIYATASGTVVRTGVGSGYGKRVIVKHKFGYSTLYAHMSKIIAKTGQHIKKGQIIGRVGSSGRATGPHVHYEVRINNKTVDPLPYLSAN